MKNIYLVLAKFHEDESSIQLAFASEPLANEWIETNSSYEIHYVLTVPFVSK